MRAFLLAFVRRDAQTLFADRSGIMVRVLGGGLVLGTLLLMARAYGDAPVLDGQGTPLAFLLTGLALSDLFHRVAASTGDALWQAALLGTLEAMLAAPRGLPWLVLGECGPRALGGLARTTLLLLLVPLLGGGPLQADPGLWPLGLLVLLAFFSLGLWATAATLLLRREGVVSRLLTGLSVLLGGVFFPVPALPGVLRPFARMTPLYLALEGLRGLVIPGRDAASIAGPLLGLGLFSALLLPAGLLLLRHVGHHGARRGSLLLR